MKGQKPNRKVIVKGHQTSNSNVSLNSIVKEPHYSSNGEELSIVKDVEFCEFLLNSEKNYKITIKTLTNCKVVPDQNKIDEEWDEILLSKGACVSFQVVENVWYILSSDGLKLE